MEPIPATAKESLLFFSYYYSMYTCLLMCIATKLILHAWVARVGKGDFNNTPHKSSAATFFPFPVHVLCHFRCTCLAQFPVPMAEISSLAGITMQPAVVEGEIAEGFHLLKVNSPPFCLGSTC
jgi:hypothetical protein